MSTESSGSHLEVLETHNSFSVLADETDDTQDTPVLFGEATPFTNETENQSQSVDKVPSSFLNNVVRAVSKLPSAPKRLNHPANVGSVLKAPHLKKPSNHK